MNYEPDKTQSNEEQDKEPANWVHTILSIPHIGGYLTSGIAIAPAFLLLVFVALMNMPEESTLNEESLSESDNLWVIVFILIVVPLTWWWLNYLEKKINLAILFPIPFINIPIKWVLYPFMLPYFGIRKIYRLFSPKHHIDNSDSLDILEKEDEQ